MPRYEFSEGASNKFWEIELSGISFTVCFGRIGTAGQTQTKSFSTPELAKKEYDKLVAEKTKKGYSLAGGAAPAPAAPASPPPGKKSSVPSASALRKDLYVYNEATGLSITSKRIGGKGWDGGGKEWMKGVRDGDLIPIELVQDDPFIMRVVVGGELEPQEADEWVGRLDWKLRVPDGDLVVCGGSEYIMEEFEDEEDAYMAEYLRHMKIPRGDYRASVYMFMGGVNGRACIQAARGGDEPDPLGEWFRRSRPGENFPAWLHNDCVLDPDEDPGHEKEWKKAKKVEDPNENYVDFLLHLVPLEAGAKVTLPELSEEGGNAGWFSTPTQCRVPTRIPLGIPAKDAEGLPKKEDPNAVYPVDVFRHTQKFARAPLKFGPVEVPVDKLQQLYRLPWFCHAWSAPQVKIELPKGASFSDGERIQDVLIARTGDTVNVGIQNSGSQSGGIRALAAVSQRLKDLPDGSVVELDAAYINEAELKKKIPMALHRYRGTVRGGKLLIDETFPAVQVERLKAALALSAQVESDAIDAGSVEICKTVVASLKRHAFFSENPAVKVGTSSIGMKKSESVMHNFIAAEIFKFSFKDTWRILDLDEVEDEVVEEEEETPSSGPPKAPRGEVISKGSDKRVFFLSDATKMDADCQKKISEIEKELLPLSFKFVADITLAEMPYGLIRAYAQPGGSVWAAQTLAPFGRGTFEFVEYFENGASLTTTTNSVVRDEIYRDAYKSMRGGKKISEMWKDHQQRSDYLAEFHGCPRKLDVSARGLVADVELSILNQEKKAARKPMLLKGDDGRTVHAADARTIHPDAPRMLDEADALMKNLGFERVNGDAVSSFFSSWVYRGYVQPGGDVWAIYQIEASTVSPPTGRWEFVTHYEKGAVLQSAVMAMSKDEPKRKIYRILDPKATGPKLLEMHEKRKPELVGKWGKPLRVKGDVNALAAEVEAAAVRILG